MCFLDFSNENFYNYLYTFYTFFINTVFYRLNRNIVVINDTFERLSHHSCHSLTCHNGSKGKPLHA